MSWKQESSVVITKMKKSSFQEFRFAQQALDLISNEFNFLSKSALP